MDRLSRVTVVLAVIAALVAGATARAEEAKEGKSCDGCKGKGGHRTPEEVFQKMDANSDGAVSKDEFVAFHEARAKTAGRDAPSKDTLEKRVAALDTDADGKLTKEEFAASAKKMSGHHGKHGKHGKGTGEGAKPAEDAKQ
jgi:hypothetical protein